MPPVGIWDRFFHEHREACIREAETDQLEQLAGEGADSVGLVRAKNRNVSLGYF